MSTHIKNTLFATLGVTLTLAAWPVLTQAREVRSLEDMKAAVRENMPPFLSDPSDVVGQLLNVPLAPPLSQTFDQQKAIGAVFGSGAVSLSVDCRRRLTPAGEPDQGDCVATNGREAGRGAFLQLSFSKNMGNGNIKFLKRSQVVDGITLDTLPTARLSDADALKMGLGFLGDAFGLSPQEIPMPPTGSKASPVRSLGVAGLYQAGAPIASRTVQKVVFLQRGFPLAKPYVNPANGLALTHVRGPGKAMVAVDDSGIVGATVTEWRELRKDPKLSSRNAKTASALIDEIAEDLFNSGVRTFERMHFEVQVDADWRGAYGLLVPAVQVAVATVPNDLTEDQQALLAFRSTAGMIKTYSLVERADVETRQ